MVSYSMKWALYAGGYAFLCATILLRLLSPVSNTLMTLLDLPTSYAGLVLAVPVMGTGAFVWGTVVEHRNRYTYALGALAGVVTAVSTVAFWILVFVAFWEFSLVLAGGVLVAFVSLVVTPVGCLVGIPLMYARRRLDSVPQNERERAPQ